MPRLKKVALLVGCFVGGSFTLFALGKKDDSSFISIGTGGVTGVYYPTGVAISKIVNKATEGKTLKSKAESTGGSTFNVNAIVAGDLTFGIVQSDRQAQAWEGEAEWLQKGPQQKLRSVFSIYSESVTLLAADDAKIWTVQDLKGKVVNIGQPGSGNRGNAIDALRSSGLDWEKDVQAEGIKASESAKLLQDGRIDAYFYTVGHPNGSFKEVTAGKRKVHFIPIVDVDALLKAHAYYAISEIPIEYYPNATNQENVKTYGVKATLCTSSEVSSDVVYALTKAVFENLDMFKTLHPALANITKESMLTGLTAPLHEGALTYFKEANLK